MQNREIPAEPSGNAKGIFSYRISARLAPGQHEHNATQVSVHPRASMSLPRSFEGQLLVDASGIITRAAKRFPERKEVVTQWLLGLASANLGGYDQSILEEILPRIGKTTRRALVLLPNEPQGLLTPLAALESC